MAENKKNEQLSKKELEVVSFVVNGCSNKEIAESLFISVNTVRKHRSNIYGKTGVNSVNGLIMFAVESGIVVPGDFKKDIGIKDEVLVLSDREREVVSLIYDGMSTKEIAAELGIGYSTVRKHIENIYFKNGFHCQAQLLRMYLKEKING